MTVHGSGKAIARTANLALQVQEKLSNTVDISVETDTLRVHDEWEPLEESGIPYNTERSISALHIKITRDPSFTPKNV